MEFLSIAKQRFSVRNYTSQHVEPERLEKILEAARIAPTVTNLQPIRLIVVQSGQSLAKIGRTTNTYGAPLVIIVRADHEKAQVRPFDKKQTDDIDASILTDHMMPQATELGLGSVWICCFNPDILHREFGLPEHFKPVSIPAIGCSSARIVDTNRFDRQRIALSQLITYER